MGKGDRKSRKGKIFRKSFGISRPRNKKSTTAVAAKKAAPKKAAAKKKKED